MNWGGKKRRRGRGWTKTKAWKRRQTWAKGRSEQKRQVRQFPPGEAGKKRKTNLWLWGRRLPWTKRWTTAHKFKTKVRTSLCSRISHDSIQLSRFAPPAITVCGSAAVLRCISVLHTTSLQGQSCGCTHPACHRSRSGGLWGSNWDRSLQDGGLTSSHLRCSSEGGAEEQLPPGSAQSKWQWWAALCWIFAVIFNDYSKKSTFNQIFLSHGSETLKDKLKQSWTLVYSCQGGWAAYYQAQVSRSFPVGQSAH